MPAKSNPADAPPSAVGEPVMTEPAQDATPVQESAPANNSVVLATTGGVDEFRSADDSFPTVTAHGTEMTEDQAKLAKAAARASWYTLRTVSGGNRGEVS